MERQLKEAFQDFMEERAFETTMDTDNVYGPEYAAAQDEASRLFDEIRALLTEGHWRLIFDYDNAMGAYSALITKRAYRAGLMDGFQLRNELGLSS